MATLTEIREALTFDHAPLEPGYCEVLPRDVDVSSRLTPRIALGALLLAGSFLSAPSQAQTLTKTLVVGSLPGAAFVTSPPADTSRLFVMQLNGQKLLQNKTRKHGGFLIFIKFHLVLRNNTTKTLNKFLVISMMNLINQSFG